jgi:hypothetical protein
VTGNVRQGPAPTCRTTAFRGYGTVQGRVRKPAHPDSNGSCGEEGGPGPGPAHVPSPSRHRSGDGNALPVPIPIFHGAAVAPPRHHACRLRHTTLELVPSCVCAPPCVCPSGERRILPSSFVPSTYPYVSVSPPRRGRRWPQHRLFSRPRDVWANRHHKHHARYAGRRTRSQLRSHSLNIPVWPLAGPSLSLPSPARLGYSPWSYSYRRTPPPPRGPTSTAVPPVGLSGHDSACSPRLYSNACLQSTRPRVPSSSGAAASLLPSSLPASISTARGVAVAPAPAETCDLGHDDEGPSPVRVDGGVQGGAGRRGGAGAGVAGGHRREGAGGARAGGGRRGRGGDAAVRRPRRAAGPAAHRRAPPPRRAGVRLRAPGPAPHPLPRGRVPPPPRRARGDRRRRTRRGAHAFLLRRGRLRRDPLASVAGWVPPSLRRALCCQRSCFSRFHLFLLLFLLSFAFSPPLFVLCKYVIFSDR